MLSKMRASIAGGHVLAHVRRAASPLGVVRRCGAGVEAKKCVCRLH